MFTLTDGREYLFQWDVNRQIKVSDPTVTEVHFCNRTSDCSLVVEVIDGLANIPNILLQENRPVRVYAYCDCYTKVEKIFEVKPRTKPSDYAYTETEIKSYERLEERLNEIEKNGVSEEVITNAVEDYLEKNPTDLSDYALKTDIPSLDGYATEQYVDEAVSNIDIPEVDFTGYATETFVKAEIAKAQLEGEDVDLSGYATIDYVDNAIKDIDFPETDLSGVAPKEHTHSIADITDYKEPDLTGYVTEEELNNKGYLTEHQSLEGYAKTEDIPSLDGYAKTSDIPSIEGLATEKYVDDAISNIDIPDTDLSNYYTKTEVDTKLEDVDVDMTVSVTDDGNGNVTIEAVEGTPGTGSSVDLSNYYTKDEVNDIVAVKSVTNSESTIDLVGASNTVYSYTNAITAISRLETTCPKGISVQFKTGSSTTVSGDSKWIGDNCTDGVFSPEANTNYEVYCYYNKTLNKVVNMVMNLGA